MEQNSHQAEISPPHIQCEVTNCAYNSEKNCVAREVRIGPHFASCNAETSCASFKLHY